MGCEGREGTGPCQGVAGQDIFIRSLLQSWLRSWDGVGAVLGRYYSPESRPRWLWAWRVLAASGTLAMFSRSVSCGLRDWHGTLMMHALCSALAGGAQGAGLHVLIQSGLPKGPGSHCHLSRWTQAVPCAIAHGGRCLRLQLAGRQGSSALTVGKRETLA